MHAGKLKWAPSGAFRLHGELGKTLEKTIRNRLCRINYRHLVDPFRYRNECDGAWRCEFWGKNVRGAILAWHLTQDPELGELIHETVEDILSTQTSDGCISSYPVEKQLESWDIWGRKYVLLGLLRYYDLVAPDRRIPAACSRMLDHLTEQLQRASLRLCDCGFHDGMAASSILGAVLGVYRITGEKRFLDLALDIVRSGCSAKTDIFADLRNGVPLKNIGTGKAYEMMSCFQGLAMLQQFIPDSEWLETDMAFFRTVRDRELFITGTGGLKDNWGEYWYDGNTMQTEIDPEKSGALGETCVAATWLHFCNELLLLTGDPLIPATLERTIYNAVLGGTDQNAARWMHRNPTPLAAPSPKLPSPDQIGKCFGTPFDGHDCCLAQGPESVALACALTLLESAENDAWYLNLYEPMESAFFRLEGTYPFGSGTMRLTFTADVSRPLYLRIPGNLLRVSKNGHPLPLRRNSWLYAGESFRNGDTLELEFDLSVKWEKRGSLAAFTSGPLVLARDSRLDGDMEKGLDGDFSFRPAASVSGFRTVFENSSNRKLCDYASAGDLFSEDNTLRVWLSCQK